MKQLFFSTLLIISLASKAQIYINSATVEYEVKVNNHKSFGEGIWADMAKENMPQFNTTYYNLIFSGNKSVYQYVRKDEKNKTFWDDGSTEDVWYNDLNTQKRTMSRTLVGEHYLIADSLMKMDWHYTNETRVIAGFQCHKAFTIIYDSVYVFAFYADEINFNGGPMSLQGLPGLILGVTIPRMYTSWVATKVDITKVDETKIIPPKQGKSKSINDLTKSIVEATKEWGGNWGQRMIWALFL